jgi:NADH-quinone oxidoreductase subunit C
VAIIMTAGEIHERVKERFGARVGELVDKGHDPHFSVDPGAIRDVCRYLKDDPSLAFDCLSNLSGVDYPKEGKIRVVYHLYSYEHRHRIVLKVEAVREDPVVPTVEDLWKAANWHEREIFDLLGVTFSGHPDLRRILMPEDWVGHPLRKDFVEPQEYHGISTRRESLL